MDNTLLGGDINEASSQHGNDNTFVKQHCVGGVIVISQAVDVVWGRHESGFIGGWQ